MLCPAPHLATQTYFPSRWGRYSYYAHFTDVDTGELSPSDNARTAFSHADHDWGKEVTPPLGAPTATPAVLLVCFVLLSKFSPSQGSGFPDCIPRLCISCTDLVWKEPGSKLQIGKTPHTSGFLRTSSPWNLFLHSPEVPALAAQESPKPAGSNPYLTAWSLRMLTPGPSPSGHHSLASLPVGSSPGVLPPFCTNVGRGLDAGLCAQGCCSSPCAVDPSRAVPRAA